MIVDANWTDFVTIFKDFRTFDITFSFFSSTSPSKLDAALDAGDISSEAAGLPLPSTWCEMFGRNFEKIVAIHTILVVLSKNNTKFSTI